MKKYCEHKYNNLDGLQDAIYSILKYYNPATKEQVIEELIELYPYPCIDEAFDKIVYALTIELEDGDIVHLFTR